MKIMISILTVLVLAMAGAYAQRAEGFVLNDAVSGSAFSLEEHKNNTVVLIFTSLSCPFSKLYEERINQLHREFAPKGFVFALINPHVAVDEEESWTLMKARMSERNMNIPFLSDEDQAVSLQFGITKLPEVIVLGSSPTGHSVVYRGAIDNNPQLPDQANVKYLERALTAIQDRKNPSPASSRPVGCNVRFVRN